MQKNRGIRAIRSIDYVIILCDDLEKMSQFYKDLFEFYLEDEETNHWVGFRVGTLFLGLRPRGRVYDGPQIRSESASIQLNFRVPPEDVDIAYQTLKEKKIDVIEAPTNQDWGHRTLFFADPENNIIEIYADIVPANKKSDSPILHRANNTT